MSPGNQTAFVREAALRAMRRSLEAAEFKAAPDEMDKKETAAASRRQLAETQTIIETNRDLKINRKLRWKYARWVFCYLVAYSVFVGLVLVASAVNICGFSLDSSVLEYLVGSTAVSAIGLVLAVTTGLFRK